MGIFVQHKDAHCFPKDIADPGLLFINNLDKVAPTIYNIFMDIDDLSQPLDFEWDKGNKEKSLLKHGIVNGEAEEVFVNFNLIWADPKHSDIEERFNILGKCNNGKLILSCYTMRNNKIRIISSRPASRKERMAYEKTFKKTPQIKN